MKATEFVKQYGWGRANALFEHIEKQKRINAPDDFTIELSFCELSYADLKCLIQSHRMAAQQMQAPHPSIHGLV